MPIENNQDNVSAIWTGPLEPPDSCPDSADIVIIGGGIVGVSTAWFLARQGVDVALCEKGHIAGEQSGRNWGWVRQQARDPREMPMILDSLKIWRELADAIGEDVGFRSTGCLFLARTEKELERYDGWLGVAKEYNLDTRILRGAELDKQLAGGAGRWVGGMYTASDGRAEPHKAAPAIARAAARQGATILTACAVRGVETEAGRVSGVVTEHGTIRTSTVLCAAGAWTSMFCRSLGISVPQLKVRGTVARTNPGVKVLDGDVFDKRMGIRRREDGGYTIAHGAILDHSITPSTFRYSLQFLRALMQEIHLLRIRIGREFLEELLTPTRWPLDRESPFERKRVLDPEPNRSALRKLEKLLGEVFPELAGIGIAESWAGMVETTPDVVPIISADERLPGFHIATGFSGHGFGIGPGAGRSIAAMLTGSGDGVDLSEFRLSRFFDGTPIRPMTTI